jgi:hypothetical protein
MSINVYDDVLRRIQRLSPDDQLRLLEDVAGLVRRELTNQSRRRSIVELRGLGREIWQHIDAQDYIDQEVSSQKVRANPRGCPPGQAQDLPLPQDIEKIHQERAS